MTADSNANGSGGESGSTAGKTPVFPNYQSPRGIPLATPKFHSPLYKVMRQMMNRTMNKLQKNPFLKKQRLTKPRKSRKRKLRVI